MNQSFATGARGFLIELLQEHLGIPADGVLGSRTFRAVAAVIGHDPRNRISEDIWLRLNIAWPSEFARCLNVVSSFEGTSFGDCNPTDIDGAGLTFGIGGFTTSHGEVQKLIRSFVEADPASLAVVPAVERQRLEVLLATPDAPVTRWNALFYAADGRVTDVWRRVLRAWGRRNPMRQLQIDLARERSWNRAVATAGRLGFATPQAHLFFLDVAVQNGGWRLAHEVLVKRYVAWDGGSEAQRLQCAAHAVAACARAPWREDVLARKLAIANGRGTVHGRSFLLENYAI